MSDQDQSSNALPFAVRTTSAEAALPSALSELLAGCRDRLAHWIASAIGVSLGNAGDDLLGMADRATSLEQQQLYFAAMEFLNAHGPDLLAAFRRGYAAQFDAGIAVLRRGHPHEVPGEPGAALLADPADQECALALGKAAGRAACQCAEQLSALDRRLAAALPLARGDQDANPLYPRALFSVLLRSVSALGASQPLALTLLEALERQVTVTLPTIYDGLSRHLADSPVLSQLAGATETAGRGDGVRAPALADPARANAAARDAAIAGLSAVARFEDAVFGQLAEAIEAATRTARARAGAKPTPAFGLAQVIAALTGLQQGRAEPRHIPGLELDEFDPDPAQVLQQLRATPLAQGSHPVDAMTIDIVAMLFDAIFADPDLPASLRAEVARLQVPVLKVALMDKAFFSKQGHPARRLLDLMANAALGRGEGDAPRLLARVRNVVDAIVADFDIEIEIITAQVERLEGFLAEEEAVARPRTTQVVDKLAKRDRVDLAPERVAAELVTRLSKPGLPALVGDFLDRHWRAVLTATYVRDGDQAASWGEVVGAMDELLWSVAPKHGAAERQRLLTSLPGLLGRLRGPIEAAGLQAVWDPFFGQLIRLHMGALHKDAPADTYQVQAAAATPAVAAVPAASGRPAMRAADLIDTDHGIEYRANGDGIDQAQEPGQSDRPLGLVQPLQVGDWVEFQSFLGTRKTLRLSWVSQLRGLYLFTNRQGENPMTLGTASLGDHLRKGTARVLSQAPLTERAVAHLLRGAEPPASDRFHGDLRLV